MFKKLAVDEDSTQELHLPPPEGAPRFDQRVLRTQPDPDISGDPDLKEEGRD